MTLDVIDWVKQPPAFKNSQNYWEVEPFRWGVTGQQARKVLQFFVQTRLSDFGINIPFSEGKVVRFPQQQREVCPLRSRTTSVKGRSVSIHPDESLLQELRQRQHTKAGCAKQRQRVAVEHSLAQIGQW